MPQILEHATATTVFDREDASEHPHEQVIFCEDAATGLQAIIGIHSTVRGPALGGTRFYPYPDQGAALTDVLRLSRGMTYKAAVAGVDLGGGKAVIIGDPNRIKTPGLLRAYGRFIDTLGGRYISAGDVGTNTADLDIIGEVTNHVVGRSARTGGSGDSAPMTALGVFQSMRAAADSIWRAPSLAGRTVGVEGLGKVGTELVALLHADGARIVVADVDPDAVRRVRDRFPDVSVAAHVLGADLDVYAPCALGGTLTTDTASTLTARIVCGAANNQLWTPDVEQILTDRGVVWVPDYVANAGGLIQVAGELRRASAERIRTEVDAIYDTVSSLLEQSRTESILPGRAADRIAEERIWSARGA
ncbi:Glu/Leu/Phe/Val dehydrogenase [Nocardia puris]|uniref:Valine dehydrogenase (NAD+) n=1 Tax=Nocardia puris TaxID=208602 RepID=A0A366DVG6_9NOCA|nr:Glu/Leu/Phe/Val dehydrogenase dimerization domain-containing protein [Nocardia puris]MBF6210160.1 Glu/Leu/Phe/Val dehydrogenase [Nocardia puris]MBF6368351.1 Glu/Leu/Phe/Val dehydrogenase [Nocardia puris]MBF6457931.1 Glu/Leu/Phe/Val dehydrogenase [Nocardia puris]RBO94090.1 valine dehydrogenase (NAD+) [Nocardia puris]